ncbi:MAG: hypothetical protein JW860_12660 [Sedimentisphaerales bacterium]|nr:hypothetical protein [Sedimentisphaerales bacterium]
MKIKKYHNNHLKYISLVLLAGMLLSLFVADGHAQVVNSIAARGVSSFSGIGSARGSSTLSTFSKYSTGAGSLAGSRGRSNNPLAINLQRPGQNLSNRSSSATGRIASGRIGAQRMPASFNTLMSSGAVSRSLTSSSTSGVPISFYPVGGVSSGSSPFYSSNTTSIGTLDAFNMNFLNKSGFSQMGQSTSRMSRGTGSISRAGISKSSTIGLGSRRSNSPLRSGGFYRETQRSSLRSSLNRYSIIF